MLQNYCSVVHFIGRPSVCRLFVCNACINYIIAKPYVVGSASITLDRAMTNYCRLSIITMSICSGFAVILNAKLLPAAITDVHRITISYPSFYCNVRYNSVTKACMGLESLWKIAFFRDRKSDAGLRILAVRSNHPSDSWTFSCVVL